MSLIQVTLRDLMWNCVLSNILGIFYGIMQIAVVHILIIITMLSLFRAYTSALDNEFEKF